MPEIGDPVWYFDENHRVYERDENGRSHGGPIWREHWRPAEVVGETRVSWIIGAGTDKRKYEITRIKKKDWPGGLALSQDDIDRREFIAGSHRIGSRIFACRDYDTLKAISDLLDDYESKK